MNRIPLAIATLECVLVASVFPQASTSIAYKYASVAYPSAISTSANSINNSNVIVGSYLDSNSFAHGFEYRNGKYLPINVPGATATEVLGINDSGDIVGVYQVPGPLNFHGFLRRNGGFRRIDVPWATFGTVAAGINGNGTIVGTFDDSQGFIYSQGTFRTWNAPQRAGETPQTQLNGINELGWIAGQVFTGGNWRGFWRIDNDLDFLEPLFAPDNQVTGVNARGDVVGCHDAASGFVSFNVETAEGPEHSERFARQQSLASCTSAINFARVIVGNYFSVSKPNGFLAVPMLTLRVDSPANHVSISNPVHLQASASGVHPVSRINVWVNSTKALQVNQDNLDTMVPLPVGNNEKVVIQAIDTEGVTTKVVQTISVH